MERRPCVLVVEDDPAVCTVIDRQLQLLGWDVVAVTTGRDAIRLVERGTPVDVLLTDIDLPDIDGMAVARAVRAVSSATRVVFMSGAAPAGPLEPRTAPFLLKPFSHAALASALDIRD